MAASDTLSDKAGDARDQIAKLRAQVDSLMRERVSPAVSDAANRAGSAASDAADMAREQAEALSDRVKEQPLIALLAAAGVGFLIGRILR
jgi:ElaB/YqjD/DUF883 family membrane-anchored ribosome-binding protein